MNIYKNTDIIKEFKIKNHLLDNDSDIFFKFKTSGTEGKTKIIFREVKNTELAFKALNN